MSSVNYNKGLFVLWLMSLTVFNSSIFGIRIFLILYSVGYPFLYLLSKSSMMVKKEFLMIIGFSLYWTLYFSLWFVINIESISFDISGPNVEMFTPFLYLTNVFISYFECLSLFILIYCLGLVFNFFIALDDS